jgi:hypothetical protein
VLMQRQRCAHTLARLRGEGRERVAAYFDSRAIGRIRRVARAIEYSVVGINEGIISTAIAPQRYRPIRVPLRIVLGKPAALWG